MVEETTYKSDFADDDAFKRGFIRGVSGALFCIMCHETCSAEEAMDILHIKEDQRDWYRPFLKEHAGKNWGVAVAIKDMGKAKNGILAEAGKNIKAMMPVLLCAISEDVPLKETGLDDFFERIVKLQNSGGIGDGLELEQYYAALWEFKNASKALPASVKLFEKIEEKYQLQIEKYVR